MNSKHIRTEEFVIDYQFDKSLFLYAPYCFYTNQTTVLLNKIPLNGPVLFQIKNAIEYAVEEAVKNSYDAYIDMLKKTSDKKYYLQISFQYNPKQNLISIEVIDNCAGLSASKTKDKTGLHFGGLGLGLKKTKEHVEMLFDKYNISTSTQIEIKDNQARRVIIINF